MYGRGDYGDPDLQSRLNTAGGRVRQARGLSLRNYWTPTPPGTEPGRSIPVGVPVDAIHYLLAELDRLLHDAVGINVRQPSSNVPPFRAQQWSQDVVSTIASASTATVTVNFRPGQTAVQDGVLGVLASLELYVIDADQSSATLPALESVTAFLTRSGSTVPGFEAMSPGGITLETITDATGSNSYGSDFPGQQVVVPVKLEPGDTMQLSITNGNAETVQVRALLQGWFYPQEVRADGIVGTLADRSGMRPGRPRR